MDKNKKIIDVAAFVIAEKEIPREQHYQIQVDRQFFVIEREYITGREILELAEKKPPCNWKLVQKFRFNRQESVELDEKIDLVSCGVERFVTQPLDCTDGRPHKRDFLLPESDLIFLNNLNLDWDAITEGNIRWIIIRSWPLPEGYISANADIALQIEGGYPTSQIDMAYFYPPLELTPPVDINALATQSIEGKVYQRWSRHRTHLNPWRPGLDDLSMHLILVTNWLTLETNK